MSCQIAAEDPSKIAPGMLLWTKKQTAQRLGVGTGVIERLMRQRKLPYLRLADRGAPRFRPRDVVEFLRVQLEREASQ